MMKPNSRITLPLPAVSRMEIKSLIHNRNRTSYERHNFVITTILCGIIFSNALIQVFELSFKWMVENGTSTNFLLLLSKFIPRIIASLKFKNTVRIFLYIDFHFKLFVITGFILKIHIWLFLLICVFLIKKMFV